MKASAFTNLLFNLPAFSFFFTFWVTFISIWASSLIIEMHGLLDSSPLWRCIHICWKPLRDFFFPFLMKSYCCQWTRQDCYQKSKNKYICLQLRDRLQGTHLALCSLVKNLSRRKSVWAPVNEVEIKCKNMHAAWIAAASNKKLFYSTQKHMAYPAVQLFQ